MQVICPRCLVQLPVTNISFDTGWAKCDSCNEIFRLADIVEGYQAPQVPSGAVIERPFDARVRLERTPTQLGIVVPPQGMRAATWGLLGFATFWLGFISFWTAGALGFAPLGKLAAGAVPREQIIFASFSTPFWLVGFGMVGGVLWTSCGSVSAYIDAGRAYIERRCLIYRRGRYISREKVQCVRPGTTIVKQESSTYSPYSAEIIYEGGSFKIPCNSQAEQDWLISEVNNFLRAVPYSPSAEDLLPRSD